MITLGSYVHCTKNSPEFEFVGQRSKIKVARDKKTKLAAMLWWFTAAPKPLKIQVFWGSTSPQGAHSPYILGDTTRPGHVTYVLV